MKFNVFIGVVLTAAFLTLVQFAALAQTAPAPTIPAAPESKISFIGYQGVDQSRVSKLIGVIVQNSAGEVVGDINDVVVQDNGQVAVVLVGVGGFLGVGEKNVGVPFSALKFTKDRGGKRTAFIDATKADLEKAISFLGEKTMFERVQDNAVDVANSATKAAQDLMKKQ